MSLSPVRIDADQFLRGHFSLPPLPQIVPRILETVNAGSAGAAEVAELIGADAGLAAQILKVVNSAYYGLPRRIGDIKHAVAYLGIAEVHRIVLVLSVMKALTPDSQDDLERFWYHSFYTALTARHVAKTFEKSLDIDDLYAAALLHDIGRLVYLRFFPEHYRELERWSVDNERFLVDAEREREWTSHTTLGAILCDHWQLPDAFKEACETHELADLEAASDAAAIPPSNKVICVSNLLVNLASIPLHDRTKDAITRECRRALDCSEGDLLAFMGEVYELRTDVTRFLEQLGA